MAAFKVCVQRPRFERGRRRNIEPDKERAQELGIGKLFGADIEGRVEIERLYRLRAAQICLTPRVQVKLAGR